MVKNTNPESTLPSTAPSGPGSNQYDKAYTYRVNKLTYDISSQVHSVGTLASTPPYTCQPDDPISPTFCFGITISTSYFNYFNILFQTISTPSFVNPTFGN